MSRDDKLVIIAIIIIAAVIALIAGFACGIKAHAAAYYYEDLSGDRERIEGGAMPCMNVEKQDVEVVEKPEIPVVTINGARLGEDLERYLYGRLSELGIAWFYPYALCQIYQESRFNVYAVNSNGLDMGLCQFRITYFPKFAREAGLYEADIFNPIDSLYVYTYLMHKNLVETGNIYDALSRYYTGGTYFDMNYINNVMQWERSIGYGK